MLKYNSVNINLAANHINIYILLGLFTLLAIIQWVLIQKKEKEYAQNGCTKTDATQIPT